MKSTERDQLISNEMCECVHFTGIQHDTCKAGVEYRQVRDESMKPYGFPCLTVHVNTCPKRQHPTLEEATATVDEQERRITNVMAAMKTAREDANAKGYKREHGGNSQCACPNCGGTLRYSVAASNGHLWGKCETADCAEWMQ